MERKYIVKALRGIALDLETAKRQHEGGEYAAHKTAERARLELVCLIGELTALCGKVSNGFACTAPKGSGCPDCTVSLHDVGAPK